jgi:hypothetical protein
MQPEESANTINYKRSAYTAVGNVTIVISWRTQNYYQILDLIQR